VFFIAMGTSIFRLMMAARMFLLSFSHERWRRLDVMVARPSHALACRKTAAALPAIGGAQAAAGAMLAGKRLGQVLGACHRQRQPDERDHLAE